MDSMKRRSYENTKSSMDQRGTPEGRSTARSLWQLFPTILGRNPPPPFLQPHPAKMSLPWRVAVEKLCRTVIKMSPFRRPQFSLKSLKGDSDRPRAAWCPYDRGRAPPEFSSHRMGEHLSKPHPEATNSCRKVTVNKAEEGRQYWIFYWRESLCYVPYCSNNLKCQAFTTNAKWITKALLNENLYKFNV